MTAAVDGFANVQGGTDGPYTHAAAVTPSDTVDLVSVSRALYIGTAGTLIVITADGDTVTFGAVTAGTLLPIRVSRVKVSGASNIVALW